jgi:hypothetical protein
MTHDEMIAVITHHKNGGEIEFKPKDNTTWEKTSTPCWIFDSNDYRAKPEPAVIYAEVIYAEAMPNRRVVRYSNSVITPKHGGTVVKFVEVTE